LYGSVFVGGIQPPRSPILLSSYFQVNGSELIMQTKINWQTYFIFTPFLDVIVGTEEKQEGNYQAEN
jgi:hypothetical protein